VWAGLRSRDTGMRVRKIVWIVFFVLLRAEGNQEQKQYFTVLSV
jgi:hypothetical protein